MDTNTKRLIAELESEVLAALPNVTARRAMKGVFKRFVDAQSGTIKLTNVKSSTIKAIGHDPLNETLRVEFLTGSIYDYLRVPATEYIDLLGAPSIGRHLNANIKPNFGTVKIKA